MASLCSGSRSLLASNASKCVTHSRYFLFLRIEIFSFPANLPCRRASFPDWSDLEPTTQPTVLYERVATDSISTICNTNCDIVRPNDGVFVPRDAQSAPLAS